MIFIAYLHATVCAVLFLLYFIRMKTLNFSLNELSFVAQNIVSGIICGYSSYLTVETGTIHPLAVLSPIMAALYLFRSRDTYEVAKQTTITGQLDDPIHREFGRGM